MESICFLYGDSPRYAKDNGRIQDVLANDEIVITAGSLGYLEKSWNLADRLRLIDKAYRYLDYWGSSVYRNSDVDHFRWQPSPGDVGDSPIKTRKGVYCYRIDGFHVLDFAKWVWNTVNLRCKGVFLDDWTDVWYWDLSDEEKDQVWKGWRRGRNWNLSRMRITERFCRSLVALRRKKIIVNGDARHGASRLFEAFGDWFGEEEIRKNAKANDIILVKGIAADGKSWAKVDKPYSEFAVGTSFKDVFKKAMELAEEYNLRLGLCYQNKPYSSSSQCNVHTFTDPRTWGKI